MRLRDRLAGLHPQTDPADERHQRIAQLRALIGDVVNRDRERHTAPARRSDPRALPVGEERHTPAGPLHVIERWLDPQHCHGRVSVRAALELAPELLALLALEPAFAAVEPARMLILDTETTGLAGGAGTVPFLIGLGSFDGGVLKVEQLFLRNFGGEVPLLHALSERLSQASLLVTYNGKSFDWPLLRTRFILNRVPLPAAPPHLDLLHCVRRVLKPRLASVRLVEVETVLLGLRREDDIDGAEIPGRYLRYLRGEDPRGLLPVLAHNESDVIALAAVLWRLCTHLARVRPDDDPQDHLAYAKLALRARDLERAQAFAEAVAAGSEVCELRLQAAQVRALVARRRGDVQAAEQAWHDALANAHCERSAGQVHLALARLYERQLRNPARAHRHARFTEPIEGPLAQGRRLGRLRRLLERERNP